MAEIAASMNAVGLLQPITITRPNGVPNLVAGLHRLSAAKQLGWETIACSVLPAETDADSIKLAEIDENLARGELSPAERAIHIAARKAIYERKNGPAKAAGGNARAKKAGQASAKSALASFTSDTVEKTGRSQRSIQVDAQRATSIPKIADVVGTSLDKGDELDALAKLPAEKQNEVISRARAGEKVSAKSEAEGRSGREGHCRQNYCASEYAAAG